MPGLTSGSRENDLYSLFLPNFWLIPAIDFPSLMILRWNELHLLPHPCSFALAVNLIPFRLPECMSYPNSICLVPCSTVCIVALFIVWLFVFKDDGSCKDGEEMVGTKCLVKCEDGKKRVGEVCKVLSKPHDYNTIILERDINSTKGIACPKQTFTKTNDGEWKGDGPGDKHMMWSSKYNKLYCKKKGALKGSGEVWTFVNTNDSRLKYKP